MTHDSAFDLEPPNEASKEGAAASDPAASSPQRTRRSLRRTPRRPAHARGEAAADTAPGDANTSGAARYLGWITSPTFYYALSFLSTVGLLLSLYNPSWGVLGKLWPHEVLGAGERVFHWNTHSSLVVALLALIATLVVGLLMKPGRARGIVTLMGVVIVLSRLQPPPGNLHGFVLPLAIALTGGALLAWRGRGLCVLLLLGTLLLAAQAIMPWDSARLTQHTEASSGYMSTLNSTLDYYGNPPPEYLEHGSWPRVVMQHLPVTTALLMLVTGLLALVGLGRRWARWTAGSLLLLLFLGSLVHMSLAGLDRVDLQHLASWQMGATEIAKQLHASAIPYLLVLAAASADLVGRGADKKSA